MYSQDLLNNMFRHPYTKIALVMRDLHVSRPTATGYLDKLAESNYLQKEKFGRSNYYINLPLVNCLMDTPNRHHQPENSAPEIKTTPVSKE